MRTHQPIDLVDPSLREATLKTEKSSGSVDSAFKRRLITLAIKVIKFPRSAGVTIDTIGDGGVRIRRYRPAEITSPAALVWVHGGGLIFGGPQQDDPLSSRVAADLGIQVFSLRYPLAPQNRFPVAQDALLASWHWILDHAAELGVDPARLAIGGESAGGGLVAALVQRLHDAGGIQPVAQWLMAPMLDDRTAADRSLDEPEPWVWTNTANHFGWSSYLGLAPGAAEVPQYAVAARREDLSGLPPAYLMWGDIELFAREDGEYADRLRAAGVDVLAEVVAGAPHGFENWAGTTEIAEATMGRARDWLRRALEAFQ